MLFELRYVLVEIDKTLNGHLHLVAVEMSVTQNKHINEYDIAMNSIRYFQNLYWKQKRTKTKKKAEQLENKKKNNVLS